MSCSHGWLTWGKRLSRALGLDYTPRSEPVNVDCDAIRDAALRVVMEDGHDELDAQYYVGMIMFGLGDCGARCVDENGRNVYGPIPMTWATVGNLIEAFDASERSLHEGRFRAYRMGPVRGCSC